MEPPSDSATRAIGRRDGSVHCCGATQAQLSDASSAVSALETELKAAEMKKKHLAKEGKDLEKKLAEARKAGGKQVRWLVGETRRTCASSRSLPSGVCSAMGTA